MNIGSRLNKIEQRLSSAATCLSCGWPLPGYRPITAADIASRVSAGATPFAPIDAAGESRAVPGDCPTCGRKFDLFKPITLEKTIVDAVEEA